MTETAAAAYAARMIEAPYHLAAAADHIIPLIDGPLKIHAATITDVHGYHHFVEEISGRVHPNKMDNYRDDPDHAGRFIWDEVYYPAGTFRVFSWGECVSHIDASGESVHG